MGKQGKIGGVKNRKKYEEGSKEGDFQALCQCPWHSDRLGTRFGVAAPRSGRGSFLGQVCKSH